MKNLTLLLASLCLFPSLLVFAEGGSDFLAKHQIKINNPNSEQIVKQAVSDLSGIFENYHPAVDASSSMVAPLQVRGTKTNPVVQASVRKCVAFLCETFHLVGTASLRPAKGGCSKNFSLLIDMSRSSEALSSYYDAVTADLCYQKNANGSGSITFAASARRGDRYSQDSTQGQIAGFLRQQVPPIAKALQASITEVARNELAAAQ
jgi:hypothetical protein